MVTISCCAHIDIRCTYVPNAGICPKAFNRIASKEDSSKQVETRTLQEEVEPQLNNQTSIVQFKEASNVVTEEISGKVHLERISNPFPDQTPRRVLERVYQIAQFQWVPGLANQTFKFPDDLFSLTPISDYLSIFQYFRAGVRIQFKMNSTPYHQGALIVGALPICNTNFYTVWMLSGMKPVVLSASVQDSATIDLPYLNPVPWLTLPAPPTCAIGSFTLAELNPLITSSPSIPASVTVTVLASFLNPQVAGFIETATAQSSINTRFTGIKAQSAGLNPNARGFGKTNNEAKSKVLAGIDSASKSENAGPIGKIIGGVSEVVKMLPIVGPIYAPIAKFISTYARNLDFPTSNEAQHPMWSYQFKNQNSCRGLSLAEPLAMYPNALLADNDFGMESSDMTVSAFAQVPMFSYYTSFSTSGTKFTMAVTPMDQLDSNAHNVVDYLQFAAANFAYWRGSIKYLLHFVSSAFYSARFRISYSRVAASTPDGDLPTQIIDVKGDSIVEITIPYLWNTYWRQTQQIGINLTPQLTIEMITPISGSSAPSSPLIYLNVWRSGGEDIQFAQMRNSNLVLPFATSTTTSTQVVGVESRTPLSKTKNKSTETKIKAQTCINTRFKQQFKSIVDTSHFSSELGNCVPECPIAIKDCIRRRSLINNTQWFTADFTIPSTYPIGPNAFEYCEPFNIWSHCFMFWRGSRRIQALESSSDHVAFNTANSSDPASVSSPGGGMYFANNNSQQEGPQQAAIKDEFEVPYFAEVPYVIINRPFTPFVTTPEYDLPSGITITGKYSNNPYIIMIAAGDDFKYMYMFPPLLQADPGTLLSKKDKSMRQLPRRLKTLVAT